MAQKYFYDVVHINNKETLALDKMEVKVSELYIYESKVKREPKDFVLVSNMNGLVPAKVVRERTEQSAMELQVKAGFEHFQPIVARVCKD